MSQTGTAPPDTGRRSGEASSAETSGNGARAELLSGSSVDSLSLPDDADAEEAAAIVAAVTEHLRAEARAAARARAEAEAADGTSDGNLWTFSVRMDKAPRNPVPTNVPSDPWVAADRLR